MHPKSTRSKGCCRRSPSRAAPTCAPRARRWGRSPRSPITPNGSTPVPRGSSAPVAARRSCRTRRRRWPPTWRGVLPRPRGSPCSTPCRCPSGYPPRRCAQGSPPRVILASSPARPPVRGAGGGGWCRIASAAKRPRNGGLPKRWRRLSPKGRDAWRLPTGTNSGRAWASRRRRASLLPASGCPRANTGASATAAAAICPFPTLRRGSSPSIPRWAPVRPAAASDG